MTLFLFLDSLWSTVAGQHNPRLAILSSASICSTFVIDSEPCSHFLVPQESKDQGEVVLSPQLDKFYEKHMYDNYGDLGKAIKSLVDEFRVLCIAVLILLTSSSDSV